MLATGCWSVPHFNGLPYLDKPVMLFWMIAASFHTLGVNELGARLPSALAAVATVLLTFDIGRLLLGWQRGLLSAIVVATSPIVMIYARLVIFDLPLTACAAAALWALLRARLGGRQWVWLPVVGLAIGLAVLTKGPVGAAIPLLVWFAGRTRIPGKRCSAGAALLAAAVVMVMVGPWVIAVLRQQPDFLRYAIVDETFLRLTSAQQFHRDAPPYFYLQTLAWAVGIWGILLLLFGPALFRLWRTREGDSAVVAFATRGTVALVVFFTLSASKRPHYILPAVIPLGLLVAIAVDAARSRVVPMVRALACVVAVVGVAALAAEHAGFRAAGHYALVSRQVMSAVGLAALGWAVLVLAFARTPVRAIAAAALLFPTLGMATIGPLRGYAEVRSSKALAQEVADRSVLSFESFRTSLPFYLGRPVPLMSRSARALTSNYLLSRRVGDLGPMVLPPDMLNTILGAEHPPLIVTNHAQLRELRRLMSGRSLEILYTDRGGVLLLPVS